MSAGKSATAGPRGNGKRISVITDLPKWLTLLSVTEHNDGDDEPTDPQCEEFASWREAREHFAFEFWSEEHERDRVRRSWRLL